VKLGVEVMEKVQKECQFSPTITTGGRAAGKKGASFFSALRQQAGGDFPAFSPRLHRPKK
jgi:hypothetical protein